MKKTILLFCTCLALAACKQEPATTQEANEAQLEDAAADISTTEGTATENAQSPDGSAPLTTSTPELPDEPMAGAPSNASAAPSAENPLFNLTIQKGQAGAVKIGMPITDLKQAYGENKLREIEHLLEGTTSMAYEVLGERRRTDLLVEQKCTGTACQVSRITVMNPAFKSQNGVGIGSTFKDVKANFTITRVGTGEGKFVAISERDNISFVLDMQKVPAQKWAGLKVKDVPDGTVVTGVMLY